MRLRQTASTNPLPFPRMYVVIALLLIAGSAWFALTLLTRSMGLMPVTMGIAFVPFLGMWMLMMAAMMIPSITPLASRYLRVITAQHLLGVSGFLGGYLSIWLTTGLLAFVLAWLTGQIAAASPQAAAAMAVGIFALGGIYQLTPLKDRCLSRCRVPFALLLRYSSWRGAWRHVRVGMHHGAYCVGCCWSLMVLMLAFGIMNLGAMLVLAALVALEKVWTRGVLLSRVVGITCLALAVAVIWLPWLAPGLQAPMASMPMANP